MDGLRPEWADKIQEMKDSAPRLKVKNDLLSLKKGQETLLYVDDEVIVRKVGQELLETLGYRVIAAEGGRQAISIYEQSCDKIDLVLLDIAMPHMGGGETYDRLKEINSDVKALLSSGYNIDDEAREILERGCNGFIQKPFRLEALSLTIRKILDNP